MKKNLFLLIFFLFFPPFSLWAQENYIVEIEGRYWRPRLTSVVDLLDDVIRSRVNLVQDLGFAEDKNSWEIRGQFKVANAHKINFSYLPLAWHGDAILHTTTQFNGQTYTIGTRIQSSLELKLIKPGYEWDFLSNERGFWGVTLDVLVLDLNMQTKEPEFRKEQGYDITFPCPVLGMAGKWKIAPWLSVAGKVSGIYAGGYGHAVDSEAGLELIPAKWLMMEGGYRFLELKGSYKDYYGNYRLDGPFAGLKIRF